MWGSDRSDRFQTVARWRGEVTPKEVSAGLSAEGLRLLPGWSTYWHTAASWPDESAYVVLVDERSRIVAGWMVAVAVLCRSRFRRGPRTKGVAMPLAVMCISLLCHLWLPAGSTASRPGSSSVALPILLLRLGAPPGSRHTLDRSVLRVAGATSLVPSARASTHLRSPLLLFVLQDRAGAMRRAELPIPVLMPYEGVVDPGQNPTRMILRESDYRHLRSLARPPIPRSGLAEFPWAQRPITSHGRQSRRPSSGASSSSAIRSKSVATWRIPVGDAKEISATLDGRPVPVFIEAPAQQAAVQVPAAGNYEFLLRRTVDVTRDSQADTVAFPVNPMPSAGIVIENAPPSVEAMGARGAPGRPPGRVDRDGARPDRPGRDPPVRAPTRRTIPRERDHRGQLLWDIEPAGDFSEAGSLTEGTEALDREFPARTRPDPRGSSRSLG